MVIVFFGFILSGDSLALRNATNRLDRNLVAEVTDQNFRSHVPELDPNIFPEVTQCSLLTTRKFSSVTILFVCLFALQLSGCLWWRDYRRDGFPTLKFGVVIADLARHLLRKRRRKTRR